MEISFRKFEDTDKEYEKLHNWCKNEFVYTWFEQRILSLEEIKKKYKKKYDNNKQELLIMMCDNKDIGYIQIYKYNKDIDIKELDNYKNIYEFDLFIGEEEYLSKGIGTLVINMITEIIYTKYKADAIILRPFKKNVRAIKCYEKCNYKLIGEYQGSDTLNNPETIEVLINTRL